MTQSIRTFIAAVVGVLLTDLVGAVPAVASVLAAVDSVLTRAGYGGISVLLVLQAVVTALIILLYQKAAQWLGDKWPKVESVMLGSSARPIYIKQSELYAEDGDNEYLPVGYGRDITDTGAIQVPTAGSVLVEVDDDTPRHAAQ